MAPNRVPLPRDPVAAAILRSELSSARLAVFQGGAAKPAIPIRATATRSLLLREMPDAAARKNACNQATFPKRNLQPRSAARDFAKYEMAAGLPPLLLSRATATARVIRQPRGPATKQIHRRAKLRPHRAHVLLPPARLRAGRIAATSRSDRIVSIATRAVRQGTTGNGYHSLHTPASAPGADAVPNLPSENPCQVPRRSTASPKQPD